MVAKPLALMRLLARLWRLGGGDAALRSNGLMTWTRMARLRRIRDYHKQVAAMDRHAAQQREMDLARAQFSATSTSQGAELDSKQPDKDERHQQVGQSGTSWWGSAAR